MVLKECLYAGRNVSRPDLPVAFNLIRSPTWALSCSTMDKEDGLQILDDAWRAIENMTKVMECDFALRRAPVVVSGEDKHRISSGQAQMEKDKKKAAREAAKAEEEQDGM